LGKSDIETVPEKLDSPLNLKIIVLIVVSVTVFHYTSVYVLEKEFSDLPSYFFSILNPVGTTIAASVVAIRYRSTKVFFRSYLFLAIAYFCAAGGEIMYFLYDYVLEEPAFPSPADIFFVPFYPLVLGHLFLNVSFFKPKIRAKSLLWLIILPVSIVVFYLNLVWGTERDGMFFLSLYYIIVSATSLTMTIYGTTIFRKGVMGKPWLLLLFGVIAFSVADVVYYNLEANDGYTLEHPVNLLWYAGYWIVTYALYKHRKIL
jgi:hypothetical protein